jgi:copper chaperone CopZ
MTNTRTEFHVTGMKCDGCAANAKAAVEKVHGVIDAEFDYVSGTGVVNGEVDPQAVCQALTQAGYPSVVKSA